MNLINYLFSLASFVVLIWSFRRLIQVDYSTEMTVRTLAEITFWFAACCFSGFLTLTFAAY